MATIQEPSSLLRHRAARGAPSGGLPLALGALGVVFGDIGTSPLYTMHTVFAAGSTAVRPGAVEIYGVVSLIFWTITVVVSVKYVALVMRADNEGEGGIMALTALVQRLHPRSPAVTAVFVGLGVLGVSLFFGDGIITPAISVLSAMEGLKVGAPGVASLVLPLTLAVIVVLFAVQRFGTHVVGRLFGPVMAVWFVILLAVGLAEIARHPGVLRGLSPSYAVSFLSQDPVTGFLALASVVLAVTGAEALYADMGHFGRAPIRRAWFWLVFPALTLNYLAQGSLILRSPSSVSNPFYLLFPSWAQIPMVALAAVATVIASQAVISGTFSVTRQALQLGYLPRLTIRHTSGQEEGQVYAPAINLLLFVGVIAVVAGFGSSAALASAYGIAVTGTFVLTTILFLVVARAFWHVGRPLVLLGAAVFLTVDVAFFAANLTKVVHGGWLPLGVGLAVFALLTTWHRGQQIVSRQRAAAEGPLSRFTNVVRAVQPTLVRVPGTAVFLNSNPRTTPLALRANVEHNHVLHERVIVLCVEVARVPYVAPEQRISVYGEGDPRDRVSRVHARIGYQEAPDVPGLIGQAIAQGALTDVPDAADITYFLSRVTLVRGAAPGMRPWRKRLFLAMARLASSPVEHFRLPLDRTVVFGEQIEV